MRFVTSSICSLFLSMFANGIVAKPIIIYDSGKTTPMSKYLKIFDEKSVPDFGAMWLADNIDNYDTPTPTLADLFPLTTKLSPKRGIASQRVNFNNVKNPICILGDDPLSLSWLESRADLIKQQQGVCWIVSMKSPKSFKRIQQAAKGIIVIPANGDSITRFFGLTGYPVLITSGMISQ